VITNAIAHPWLNVEFPPPPPQPDAPEAAQIRPVAIDAGLDQSEPSEEGGVAQTIASADDADPVPVEDPPQQRFGGTSFTETQTLEEQD
jgi:hypothetical protein